VIAANLPMLGPDWLDPEQMITGFIDRFGVWALVAICAIILIETGLLFPFLPGDSLLFTVGLFIGTGDLDVPLWVACLALFAAAFIGDQIGYAIGHAVGPRIFSRPDSRFFKKQHIDSTHAFFEKYGGRAIVLARFVPIVRTYIPVAAGIGKMPYAHFIKFNVIGAFLWAVGVTLLGYWLGSYEFVRNNIEAALVLIVAVSLLPVVIEWLNHRRERRSQAQTETAE